MIKTFILAMVMGIFMIGTTYAQEPIINKNVHVMQNATANQCTDTWKGRTYPEAEQVLSGAGQADMQTGAMVQSCTGCALDPASHDCVCSTCYGYYN